MALSREDVFASYRANRDPGLRENLVLKYAPLVRYMAGRIAIGLPPQVEVDDLISYGIFGLMDALEKFDSSRGIKFETYALARIRGAMLDGLRAMDWVPTSLRQKAKGLERAFEAVENRLGRSASDAEVAAYLQIDVEELEKRLLEVAAISLISLDDVWDREEKSSRRVIDALPDTRAENPEENLHLNEVRRLLASAVEGLPEKERLVVTLYYYEGLTAKEIAKVLGVSQSRISQLHSKAILRLRGKLARAKKSLF
ncbi:MAG: FliA/WhiG family RNA polymerase sigma factor [Firmicutes bacterium]|nr:FliA/WhiG family RNA polymerase sigma factor [Bacillota bacterium]